MPQTAVYNRNNFQSIKSTTGASSTIFHACPSSTNSEISYLRLVPETCLVHSWSQSKRKPQFQFLQKNSQPVPVHSWFESKRKPQFQFNASKAKILVQSTQIFATVYASTVETGQRLVPRSRTTVQRAESRVNASALRLVSV